MTAGILAREGAILALLTLVGVGPAACLPRSWGRAIRLALSPAFGLAIAAAVLTTISFVEPLRHSLWFAVVPLAALSTALAVHRHRSGSAEATDRRQIGGLVLIAVWCLGIFSLPLLARPSYGPMGYGIFDAPGYGASIFGYARNTTDHPLGVSPGDFAERHFDDDAWGESWDLTTRYAWGFVHQHTGATTIPAVVTIPLDWPAWTLVTPFMAVLATVVGLGVFGAGLLLFDRRLVPATLASVAAVGPVLLQIHVDGSLGLLAGLALFPGILICTAWICEGAGWSGAILLGILLAGLQAVYPELLPIAGFTIATTWFGHKIGTRPRRVAVRPNVGVPFLLAGALAAVLSPRTLPWTLDYLTGLVFGDLAGLRDLLINYNMRPRYLLGWIFGTRDFYSFAFQNPGGPAQVWWGLIVPFLALVVAAVGLLVRRRQLLPFGALALAAVLQAVAAERSDCSYCVQRSLLVVAIPLPLLVASGVLALGRRPVWRMASAGVLGTLLWGMTATMVRTERRAIDAAYMPSKDIEVMAKHADLLPKDGGAVALEGFDSIPIWSWAELPTAYMALRESGRRLSVPTAHNDYGGLSYPRTRPFGHPSFTPDYGWVLTRFGALDNGRQTVARAGALSLQRRVRPFDVTLVRGVGSDVDDRQGIPWVAAPGRRFGLEQGPLTAWVSGPPSGTVWVEVRLRGPAGTSVVGPPGTKTWVGSDGEVSACLPAPDQVPVRVVTFQVTTAPAEYDSPDDPDLLVHRPPQAVRLLRLRAQDGPCSM